MSKKTQETRQDDGTEKQQAGAADMRRRKALSDLAKLGALAGPAIVTILKPDPARAESGFSDLGGDEF